MGLDYQKISQVPEAESDVVVVLSRLDLTIALDAIAEFVYPEQWKEWSLEINDAVHRVQERLIDAMTVAELVELLCQCTGQSSGAKTVSVSNVYYGDAATGNGVTWDGNSSIDAAAVAQGWAIDENDRGGVAEMACYYANILIDTMLDKVNQLENIWELGITAIDTIALILGTVSRVWDVITSVSVEEAAGVYDALNDGGWLSGAFDDVRTALEDMRQPVVCTWEGGGTIEHVLDIVNSFTDGLPLLPRLLARNLGWVEVLTVMATGGDGDNSWVPDERPDGYMCGCEEQGYMFPTANYDASYGVVTMPDNSKRIYTSGRKELHGRAVNCGTAWCWDIWLTMPAYVLGRVPVALRIRGARPNASNADVYINGSPADFGANPAGTWWDNGGWIVVDLRSFALFSDRDNNPDDPTICDLLFL